MYQGIRRMINPPDGASPLINPALLQYPAFLAWITADNHPGNTPANNASAAAYRDYIHKNLNPQIAAFFARQMDTQFIDNIVTNTFLKTQATNYIT
jgi:hypothetical protein